MKSLSQTTFSELLETVRNIRLRAAASRDLATYGDAEKVDALLYRFVSDLIVEGRVPEATT